MGHTGAVRRTDLVYCPDLGCGDQAQSFFPVPDTPFCCPSFLPNEQSAPSCSHPAHPSSALKAGISNTTAQVILSLPGITERLPPEVSSIPCQLSVRFGHLQHHPPLHTDEMQSFPQSAPCDVVSSLTAVTSHLSRHVQSFSASGSVTLISAIGLQPQLQQNKKY